MTLSVGKMSYVSLYDPLGCAFNLNWAHNDSCKYSSTYVLKRVKRSFLIIFTVVIFIAALALVAIHGRLY